MSRTIDVRPGVYYDSVTLMQLSRALTEDDAVGHAQVAMGTELNLDLLVDNDYPRPSAEAGDLVIAFETDDEQVERIRALVDHLLAESGRRRAGAESTGPAARTIRTAAGAGATVALISVPGTHAFREAIDAIEAGLHPLIFSDNVSIEHEILIKQRAAAAGVVAMGPDCGTVILDGVGLGFANVVRPGPIALVSASGTGVQQVCALTDLAGVGVSHAIGLGGRDLDDDVAGGSALPAIRLLDADPAVEVIGIIAKEIGPQTAIALDDLLAGITTPSVIIPTNDLTAGTEALLAQLGSSLPELPTWTPTTTRRRGGGRVLGLYSGGTLATEAALILAQTGTEAEVIDLGDDLYTQGRPHPMIDSRLRLERLAEAAQAEEVGAVLVDVVLGHGSNPDPAAELAPLLAELSVPAFAALIGTSGDPQGLQRQAEALAAAGAEVFLSNSEATRKAALS